MSHDDYVIVPSSQSHGGRRYSISLPGYPIGKCLKLIAVKLIKKTGLVELQELLDMCQLHDLYPNGQYASKICKFG